MLSVDLAGAVGDSPWFATLSDRAVRGWPRRLAGRWRQLRPRPGTEAVHDARRALAVARGSAIRWPRRRPWPDWSGSPRWRRDDAVRPARQAEQTAAGSPLDRAVVQLCRPGAGGAGDSRRRGSRHGGAGQARTRATSTRPYCCRRWWIWTGGWAARGCLGAPAGRRPARRAGRRPGELLYGLDLRGTCARDRRPPSPSRRGPRRRVERTRVIPFRPGYASAWDEQLRAGRRRWSRPARAARTAARSWTGARGGVRLDADCRAAQPPAGPGASSAPGSRNWSPGRPGPDERRRSPPSCTSASASSPRTWTVSGTRPAAAAAPT